MWRLRANPKSTPTIIFLFPLFRHAPCNPSALKPWVNRGNLEALLHRMSARGRPNSDLLGRQLAVPGEAFGVETCIRIEMAPPDLPSYVDTHMRVSSHGGSCGSNSNKPSPKSPEMGAT